MRLPISSLGQSRVPLRHLGSALLLAILAVVICAHRPALPRDSVTASSIVPLAIRIPAFVLRSLTANF